MISFNKSTHLFALPLELQRLRIGSYIFYLISERQASQNVSILFSYSHCTPKSDLYIMFVTLGSKINSAQAVSTVLGVTVYNFKMHFYYVYHRIYMCLSVSQIRFFFLINFLTIYNFQISPSPFSCLNKSFKWNKPDSCPHDPTFWLILLSVHVHLTGLRKIRVWSVTLKKSIGWNLAHKKKINSLPPWQKP